MAATSERVRLIAKVKYSDNGTLKNGTVALGPGGVINPDQADNETNVEALLTAFQKITTDTIVGYQIEYLNTWDNITFGTPGTMETDWEDLENVRLINNYTNGEKSSKETIKRPATAATTDDLRSYGQKAAQMGNGTTAIDGYFIGSTVDSAWKNN